MPSSSLPARAHITRAHKRSRQFAFWRLIAVGMGASLPAVGAGRDRHDANSRGELGPDGLFMAVVGIAHLDAERSPEGRALAHADGSAGDEAERREVAQLLRIVVAHPLDNGWLAQLEIRERSRRRHRNRARLAGYRVAVGILGGMAEQDVHPLLKGL